MKTRVYLALLKMAPFVSIPPRRSPQCGIWCVESYFRLLQDDDNASHSRRTSALFMTTDRSDQLQPSDLLKMATSIEPLPRWRRDRNSVSQNYVNSASLQKHFRFRRRKPDGDSRESRFWDPAPGQDDGPKEKASGCYSLLGEFECGLATCFPPLFSVENGDLIVASRRSGGPGFTVWQGLLTGFLLKGTHNSFLFHSIPDPHFVRHLD